MSSAKSYESRELGDARPKLERIAAPGPLPMARELLTAGVELDPETEREREARMESLKSELAKMLEQGKTEAVLDAVMSMVVKLERENERFAWRLLRAARFRFGRQTEKLSREELTQLLFAFGGDEAAATREELAVPAPPPPTEVVNGPATDGAGVESNEPKKKSRKRKPGGATRISPDVPRKTTLVPVPESERTCAICGADKKCFGTISHQRIVFVPAHLEVHEEVREKMACTSCRTDVSVAERQVPNILRRRIDPSLIVKLVHDKCVMSLPLDRQRRELERLGLSMPEQTIQSHWAYATDLLAPVGDAAVSLALGSLIVATDDTVLKVLSRAAKGGVRRGHLWCFVGTDGTPNGREVVGYTFAPDWTAARIVPWFSAIEGMIQCDDYAGYASEVADDDGNVFIPVPDDRRLGCGMHVRRKFHDALLGKDRRAAVPLDYFAKLYAIEEACKKAGLDAEARTRVRLEQSLPIFDSLYEWIEELDPKLLPRSPLREATRYAIGQKVFLRRCFEDGRFEIDNGRVERRIKPFAVGRRNFLFTGSDRGGQRLATAFTLIENCLSLGIDPRAYLEDVIIKLERGWPLARLSELIPQRWAIEHAGK